MSRIGNKEIIVPTGVELNINGNVATVKGPKGTLTKEFDKHITLNVNENVINVVRESDAYKALHGLTRTLLSNMIDGVTKGFDRTLEINGVGYKAAKQGNKLVLTLGYSHPVEFVDGDGITLEVPSQNTIIVKGIDKEAVGQMAANIRAKRPPEPYKGKGIKYAGEVIRRKEGKAGAKK